VKCTGCFLELPVASFSKDRTSPGGLRRRCKKCTRQSKLPRVQKHRKFFGDGREQMEDFLAELEDARSIMVKIDGPDCAAVGLGVAIYRLKTRLGLLRSEN
jgi:hypothetical protein